MIFNIVLILIIVLTVVNSDCFELKRYHPLKNHGLVIPIPAIRSSEHLGIMATFFMMIFGLVLLCSFISSFTMGTETVTVKQYKLYSLVDIKKDKDPFVIGVGLKLNTVTLRDSSGNPVVLPGATILPAQKACDYASVEESLTESFYEPNIWFPKWIFCKGSYRSRQMITMPERNVRVNFY